MAPETAALDGAPPALASAPVGVRGGLGFKLTALMILLVVVALVASTVIANTIITRTFTNSAEARTHETAKTIGAALQGIASELAVRTETVAAQEEFQKSLSFHQDADVEHALKELVQKSGTTLALVVGDDGQVQTSPGAKGDDFVKAPVLADARARHAPLHGVFPVGGKVYLMAVEPIEHIGSSLGFLVNARVFDDQLCDQLSARADAGVALFSASGRLASSHGAQALEAPLDKLWATLAGGADEAVGGRVAGGGDRFQVVAEPLRTEHGLAAGLLTALSEKDLVAVQKRTNRGFLFISLIIGLAAATVGFLFARRLSRPLAEITRSFSAISTSGDLSLRIDKKYPDEIGHLAETFNHMQERIFGLHQKVAAAEERMRKELEMAAIVQELLFSRTGTVSPQVQMVGYNKTSSETGGDWYAIFDDPVAGRTLTIIADVTGHGAPAALITAITHGFFHGNRQEIGTGRISLIEIMQRLNRTVLEAANGSLVMTVFIADIDHRTRKMTYVNAAHPQPLLVRAQAGKVRARPVASPPTAHVGASLETQFVVDTLDLQPDDFLFLFTDGLVECENEAGEAYGMQRLISALRQATPMDGPAHLRDRLVSSAMGFYAGRALADDVTFIVGKVS
jgi:serine phosphatase RsbU (regulator of sigma subunit)